MTGREKLAFEYRKLGISGFEARRVQPYYLACIGQQWSLFAHNLVRSQLHTFVLSRMLKVQNTRMRFRKPPDFSITKHLSESLGVFSTNGRFKVWIAFDDFAARLVGERNWHPSQKIKQLPGGTIDLRLELGSLEEIER